MDKVKMTKRDARFGMIVLAVAFAVLCVASFAPDVLGVW